MYILEKACLVARLLDLKSSSWVRRVYKRVRLRTVREVVHNVLWQVRGIPELGDRALKYDVWRSERGITCSCQLSSWGYTRKICTHLGAVLTEMLLQHRDSVIKLTLFRFSQNRIVKVLQSCSPLVREINIGGIPYTVIVCTCGLCDKVEIIVEKERGQVSSVSKSLVKVPLKLALFLLPELAEHVA